MSQTRHPNLQAEWPSEPAGPPPPRRSPFAFLRELPALIAIAFGVALLLKTLLLQAFYIPSPSMVPTLVENDRILVNKFAYRFREPVRGEVIVFVKEKDRRPKPLLRKVSDFLFEGLGVTMPAGERDFVKRIVGLPGETVRVTETAVWIKPVKGKRFKLDEPYINEPGYMGQTHGPTKVPDGHYFVMGDNRGSSLDGRSFGPIKRADIIGKAFVRIWPPRRIGILHVPQYAPAPVAKPSADPSPSTKAPKKRAAPAPLPLVPVPAFAVAAGLLPLARRR